VKVLVPVPVGHVTVTVAAPVVPGGVVKVIVVAFTTVTPVAATPFTATVAPAQKFIPVRVTTVPPVVEPDTGEMPVIVGRVFVVEIMACAPAAPGRATATITGAAYAPYPPVPTAPVRRSRRWLWIAIPLIALALIGALIPLVAIKAQDWNTAHSLLDDDLAAKTTPTDLQTTWQRRVAADGAIDHFTFGGTNVSNFNGRVSGQVTGTLVWQGGASDPKIITLVQEGGQWKLSSLP